jgi:transcriptional regulator with XRE-family HTH domain
MNIGKTIKTLRLAASLSQKELAARIDLSASALSLIESGDREPTVATLQAVSRVLGVPLSVLLVENEGIPDGLTPQQRQDVERVQELLVDVVKTLLLEKLNTNDRREPAAHA